MRCSSLDGDGRQCRNTAIHGVNFHGDSEIYFQQEGLSWVRIYLCRKHSSHFERDRLLEIPAHLAEVK